MMSKSVVALMLFVFLGSDVLWQKAGAQNSSEVVSPPAGADNSTNPCSTMKCGKHKVCAECGPNPCNTSTCKHKCGENPCKIFLPRCEPSDAKCICKLGWKTEKDGSCTKIADCSNSTASTESLEGKCDSSSSESE